MGLESKKARLELSQRIEVIGRENFSLNYRKVDLDLVEPTGMDRCVNKDGVGPFGAETVNRLLPTVNRAIVHDPEDAAGGLVGGPGS